MTKELVDLTAHATTRQSADHLHKVGRAAIEADQDL